MTICQAHFAHTQSGCEARLDAETIRASDGANLGTFPVGPSPTGIAYDGSNIWVSCTGNSTLVKLRPNDGVILETYTSPSGASEVMFDGATIWFTDGNTSASRF